MTYLTPFILRFGLFYARKEVFVHLLLNLFAKFFIIRQV